MFFLFMQDFSYKKQIQRPRQNNKSEVTTEVVLKKADFRVSVIECSKLVSIVDEVLHM